MIDKYSVEVLNNGDNWDLIPCSLDTGGAAEGIMKCPGRMTKISEISGDLGVITSVSLIPG